jgi:hypothetical protein
MEDVWTLIRTAGPNTPLHEVAEAMLNNEEQDLMRNMMARVDTFVVALLPLLPPMDALLPLLSSTLGLPPCAGWLRLPQRGKSGS